MNKAKIAELVGTINTLKANGASPTELTKTRHALLDAVKHIAKRRLQNRRQRAGKILTGRKCLTCKVNIDNRGRRAEYCEPCAVKRREEKERQYRRDYDAKRRGKS